MSMSIAELERTFAQLRLSGARDTLQTRLGEDVVDRAVQRRRHALRLPEFHHAARQPAHFQPVAALQVVVHGGSHVGRHRVRPLHRRAVREILRQVRAENGGIGDIALGPAEQGIKQRPQEKDCADEAFKDPLLRCK